MVVHLHEKVYRQPRTYDKNGEKKVVELSSLLDSSAYHPIQILTREVIEKLTSQGRILVELQRHQPSLMNEGNDFLKKMKRERKKLKKPMSLKEQEWLYRSINYHTDMLTPLSTKGITLARNDKQRRREMYKTLSWMKPDVMISSKHLRAQQSLFPEFPVEGERSLPCVTTSLLGERALSPDGFPVSYLFSKDPSYKNLDRDERMKRRYKIGFLSDGGDQISETGNTHFLRAKDALDELPKIIERICADEGKNLNGLVHICGHQLTTSAMLQHILGKDGYDFEFLYNMNGAYKLGNGRSVLLSYARDQKDLDWRLHAYNVETRF